MKKKILSLPTIKRLPSYLNILRAEQQCQTKYISTSKLIDVLGINPITVRKDLAQLEVVGTPRVGYEVDKLIIAIEKYLGWDRLDSAFIIGAGSLGSALLGYKRFAENGFNIVAAFDTADNKVGQMIKGKKVFHISKLSNLASRMKISLAILTTPCEVAQTTADLLVECGFKGIWNFTRVQLVVPKTVVVHNEDLNSGLAVFSVKLAQNRNE